jgi:putative peptidoglycan lipid II flippase
VLLPDLARAGFFARTTAGTAAGLRSARHVLVASAPLALGAAVYQVNVMIDGIMAQYLLPRGGATTYYLANRIQQLPLALVATAATSAVFPALKALAHKRRLDDLRGLHDRTHLAIGFISLPATAGLLTLALPITAVLLERGEFSPEGSARTALGLQVLALALVPAGAAGLMVRTYYALGDFRTPVRVSAWLLLLNFGLNLLFLVGLRLDIEGLALSTALVSWTNVVALLAGLRGRMPPVAAGAFLRRSARLALATLACGAAAWGTHRLLGGDPRSPLALAAAIAAGMAAYAGACQVLGVEEWLEARARWSRRFGARSRGGPR